MAEQITFTKHSVSESHPRLHRPVLVETEEGYQYVAMRCESTVKADTYFWALIFNEHGIGVIANVVYWFEI